MILSLAIIYVFVLGLAIGSFLNVCVGRLPYEKSLLWPGSRCPVCWQKIRFRDNIPIVSYVLLRGRCRSCGCPISWRYPFVELFTGVVFAVLYYLEMVANVLNLPMLQQSWLPTGLVPIEALWIFLHHAVLVSFLIVVSLCDLNEMEIPLPITVTGTIVGLVLATCFPWPFPESPPPVVRGGIAPLSGGVYSWPVWYPLPSWMPEGSWQLGLATGLAGAIAGMAVLRVIRFMFGVGRGIEGMGVGDADLMMMAGAFIGWQPVVLAFFVAVVPGLFFALYQRIHVGNQVLPFGPSLALGVVLTVLFWRFLGPPFAELFFGPTFLLVMSVGGSVLLLVISFLLRLWNLLLNLFNR